MLIDYLIDFITKGKMKFLGIAVMDSATKFKAKFPSGFYKSDLYLYDQRDENILEMHLLDDQNIAATAKNRKI